MAKRRRHWVKGHTIRRKGKRVRISGHYAKNPPKRRRRRRR
jgi:hypothetical protein